MSIRWIRNVEVDSQKKTFEILLGDREISDKCYVRVDNGEEQWFVPKGESRVEILSQGIDILKNKYSSKKITYPNGKEFDWV